MRRRQFLATLGVIGPGSMNRTEVVDGKAFQSRSVTKLPEHVMNGRRLLVGLGTAASLGGCVGGSGRDGTPESTTVPSSNTASSNAQPRDTVVATADSNRTPRRTRRPTRTVRPNPAPDEEIQRRVSIKSVDDVPESAEIDIDVGLVRSAITAEPPFSA